MLPLAVTLLDGFKALKEQLQLLFHNNKKKVRELCGKSFSHSK